MVTIKRIGIITSGGDCGGLNAVIKGASQMATSTGVDAFIIPSGYAGLYNLVDKERLVRLDEKRIDALDTSLAGSAAGNARVKISRISNPDRYQRVKEGMAKFSIDGLVIAGGDDTGSVVVDLTQNGIPCVHVPKTMDLDLHTYSVGGDSAVNRIARFTNELKTTGRSHNRIMVLEVFGRYAGHTVFRGGVGGDADCILIPEIPVDFDVVYEHMKRVYVRRVRESASSPSFPKGGTYVIVVTEGLRTASGELTADDTVRIDAFGHKKLGGSGKYVRQRLTERIEHDPDMAALMKAEGLCVEDMNVLPEIRETAPKYLVRSGNSSALDVNFGRDAGAGAVVLLMNGITGVTVSGVIDGEVQYVATSEAIKQRTVDERMISFYEAQGICFGRKPVPYEAASSSLKVRSSSAAKVRSRRFSAVREAWCYL